MNAKQVMALLLFGLGALLLGACAPAPGASAGSEVPTLIPTAVPVDVSTVELCTDKNTGASLSYAEAVEIAQRSQCLAEGQLKATRFCNQDTGTWWLDLALDAPNCNPACVVDLNGRTAEINYRCTGVLPLQETQEPTSEPVQPPAEPVEPATDVPAPVVAQGSVPVIAWYGRVKSVPAGGQFDDYLMVLPEGTAELGLTGANADIEAQIVALRDKEAPNQNAHFWGTLTCPVPDYNGCQLLVERMRVDGPSPLPEPESVEAWEGLVYSGPAGPRSGGDDYFVTLGDWSVQYGIDSFINAAGERELENNLTNVRDTGMVVRIWGQLLAGIPDWNGTQIQVSRIEVLGEYAGAMPPAPEWPETDDGMQVFINEKHGYSFRYPAGASISSTGPVGFASDELPAGMTAEDYMAQLQEQYGDQLCVHLEYGLGYLTISAPANENFRYVPCGRTGVGVGEMLDKSEEILVAGQTVTAQGFELVSPPKPCQTLACHNETLVVVLEDGTRIEYGARPVMDASFEDYLQKGKGMILQILASLELDQ